MRAIWQKMQFSVLFATETKYLISIVNFIQDLMSSSSQHSSAVKNAENTTDAGTNARIKAFIEVQLGKNANAMSPEQQRLGLENKYRRLLIMLAVNIGIILFFGYSFFYDITQLGPTWLVLIGLFFLLNILMLGYQWNQLNEAIQWLKNDASLLEEDAQKKL